ncbi:hypothetical protein [Corynebacterium camporealensis]|nr:hypothetical protein [Corynebacterium camporealensis]
MTKDTNNVKVDLTDPWDRFQKGTGRLQVIRTHEIWDGDMVADVLNFERDEQGVVTVNRTGLLGGDEWHATAEDMRRVGEDKFIAMIRGDGRIGPLTGTISKAKFFPEEDTTEPSELKGEVVNLSRCAVSFPQQHLSGAMKQARSRQHWLAFETADKEGIESVVYVPPARRMLAQFYFDGRLSRFQRLIEFRPMEMGLGIRVTAQDDDDIVRSEPFRSVLNLRLLTPQEVEDEFSLREKFTAEIGDLESEQRYLKQMSDSTSN